MNGALKTVKGVSLSGDDYLERPLVVIAAYFASSHGNLLEGEQREKVQNVRQRRWLSQCGDLSIVSLSQQHSHYFTNS